MTKNWDLIAEKAQKSLDYFYQSEDSSQYLNNFYPMESETDNEIFNYWWLAHTVDVKIDGYLRTNNKKYLDEAEEVYYYNKARNKGTLVHVYYDDMLWNALASFRLYEITSKPVYLEDAKIVWQDLVDTGWNDHMGGGFAWRKIQMDYKNTPVNLPFIILSLKLYQLENKEMYLNWAYKTWDWTKEVLLRDTFFVEDGINREGDGRIDIQWEFTYNQGVFIGSCIEFYHITKDYEFIRMAKRNADESIRLLSDGKVFKDEGEGGDEGLFKGIFYRYFAELAIILNEEKYVDFIEDGITVLVENAESEHHFMMGMDWYKPQSKKTPFSAQLSGIMAIEMFVKISKAMKKNELEM